MPKDQYFSETETIKSLSKQASMPSMNNYEPTRKGPTMLGNGRVTLGLSGYTYMEMPSHKKPSVKF